MSNIYHNNWYYYSHILITQYLYSYNSNCFTSRIVRLKMFSSTNTSRRREIRLQTRERAIVFNLSSQNITSSNNFSMFSSFINRITELFDDVQFENFDKIDDSVTFDDVDVSTKHISIFESLISNTNQTLNWMSATHFNQSETQRKDNVFSLSSNNDAFVFVIVVDSNTIFKQMKML